MTAPQIPEDILKAAEAVHLKILGRGIKATVEAIARAILAERERIALMIENYDWVKGGTIDDIAAAIRGEG